VAEAVGEAVDGSKRRSGFYESILYNVSRDQLLLRAEFHMLKTLHATALAATLMLFAGCSSSNTSTAQNSGGVAAMIAGSMPGGAVSQNGQTVTAAQNAANSPNVNTIVTAINTANNAPATTPGTVSNALTPANIMAAIAAVQAANAAKQGTVQTSPNAIGPGAFIAGPGTIGVDTLQGPQAFVIQPTN
jgi:hypothetical protein